MKDNNKQDIICPKCKKPHSWFLKDMCPYCPAPAGIPEGCSKCVNCPCPHDNAPVSKQK